MKNLIAYDLSKYEDVFSFILFKICIELKNISKNIENSNSTVIINDDIKIIDNKKEIEDFMIMLIKNEVMFFDPISANKFVNDLNETSEMKSDLIRYISNGLSPKRPKNEIHKLYTEVFDTLNMIEYPILLKDFILLI